MISLYNAYFRFLNTTQGVFFGSFIWSILPLFFFLRNSSYRVRRSFVRTTFFKVIGVPLFSVYLIWALANTIKEVFWYDIQFSSSLLLFPLIGCIAFCFTHNPRGFKKTRLSLVMKIIGYVLIIMSAYCLYISYKEFINPTCYYNLKKTPKIFVDSIKGAEAIIDANLPVFEESTTFPKFAMLKTMIKACPFAVYTNLFCTRTIILYVVYFLFAAIVVLYRLSDEFLYLVKRAFEQKKIPQKGD